MRCNYIHLCRFRVASDVRLCVCMQTASGAPQWQRMQLAAVKHDKDTLRLEKQQLRGKVSELNGSVARLSREKVELERSLELEEEAFVNSLFRQVAHVMDNYKAMDEVRAPLNC
jgi:hypothetical protein